MRRQSARRTNLNLMRLMVLAVAACLTLLAASFAAPQRTARKPISKKGLLEAIRLNGLSTRELIQHIEQRGVNFQLTAEEEAEFRAAGARPEVIAAVRANYRPEEPTVNSSYTNNTASKSKPVANVPPGPPLSKNEIITLLQSGVPAARVEQFVEARGVNFTLTPEREREIKAAGGTPSLLSAIKSKASTAHNASDMKRRPAKGDAPDYDDLTDQATAALQAGNLQLAVELLQQAIRLDSSQPPAFALLGLAQLYGFQDIYAAEQPMRAAIERGGGAVFRVFHDHNGFFNSYCQGSFFVTKTGVTFRADDGNHTFEAHDSEIEEIKLNSFVGSELGAFHLKVRREQSKAKNYNFAPLTRHRAESLLIMNLIRSYQ